MNFSFEDADQYMYRIRTSSDAECLRLVPVLQEAAKNKSMMVRRLSVSGFYELSTRPNRESLIGDATTTLVALLNDSDLPIRRMSILTIACLHPNPPQSVFPALESYLTRSDAVDTIGPVVLHTLLQADAKDPMAINAVLSFMQRPDQTTSSKITILNSISATRPHDDAIARQVVSYIENGDEETALTALRTLGQTGDNVVERYRSDLTRIANDQNKSASVRTAATNLLTAKPN